MDILIAPSNSTKLIQVKLPQPKNGSLQLFFYDEDNIALYESTKYFDQYRSWFLDDLFCKDGHFHLLTKIDPLFIFTPQVIKFASEQFRTLHDICSTFANESSTKGSSRLDYALGPEIDWNSICDTKELDDELFVRFNEKKTLDWLLSKHDRTMAALKLQLDPSTSKATLISYATDLIDLYLPPSLSDQFKSAVRSKSILVNDEKNDSSSLKQGAKRPSKGSIMSFMTKK